MIQDDSAPILSAADERREPQVPERVADRVGARRAVSGGDVGASGSHVGLGDLPLYLA